MFKPNGLLRSTINQNITTAAQFGIVPARYKPSETPRPPVFRFFLESPLKVQLIISDLTPEEESQQISYIFGRLVYQPALHVTGLPSYKNQ